MHHRSNIEGCCSCSGCVTVKRDSTVVEVTGDNCTDHRKDEKRKSAACCDNYAFQAKALSSDAVKKTGQEYADKVERSSDGMSDC